MGLKEIVKTPDEMLEPAVYDHIYLRDRTPNRRMIELFRTDSRVDGFEALPTPIMILCSRLHIIYANSAWLIMVGHTRSQVIGRHLFDVFPESPDKMTILKDALQDVLKGQTTELEAIPYRVISKNSPMGELGQKPPVRFWSIQNSPFQVNWHDGPFILQTARDVSESVAMREQANLLREELQHRLRNTVSLALGVLRTRARKHTRIEDLVKDVTERLRDLASQHDALMPANSFSNGLEDILSREILPFASQSRVSFKGPSLILTDDMAVSVSLLVHELVSNAVKHGSFSTKRGRLACSWSVEDSRLNFTWQESGVKCAGATPGQGFGSVLLDRLPGVDVSRAFTKDGLFVEAIIQLSPVES